jgi:hypothetical protein
MSPTKKNEKVKELSKDFSQKFVGSFSETFYLGSSISTNPKPGGFLAIHTFTT